MKIGLYLFDNDCRLSDNPALSNLTSLVDSLLCIYVPSNNEWTTGKAHFKPSPVTQGYRDSTLWALQQSLVAQNQVLYVIKEKDPITTLRQIVTTLGITHIGRTVHPGSDEHKVWLTLQDTFPDIHFSSAYSATLFTPEQLPIDLNELPPSFTPFRKKVEDLVPSKPVAPPTLPPAPIHVQNVTEFKLTTEYDGAFPAGESQAQQQLKRYFKSNAAKYYKETRNALFGEQFSTQFSPILATGAISPRQIRHALTLFEQQHGANESTYWIWFELLWREYFHWYALKHQHKLFRFSGVKHKKPHTSFYPERFQKWCQGQTPSALVNAIMNELTETGWISNRARQITASYLVNELQVDWRYGAAFFEQHLIDYDVAANWGNWQYIAGVGADPRGGRHFNVTKQQSLYDPHGEYIKRWQGAAGQQLDSRDYVDWPLGSK
ncbi:DASH family cryptochrome [Pseudoalteromonas piscicida]|uniref:Cryptochrome DASH n=1 Tax=Pseudoalteromonas piscicida TaxID=43662 RepID=A0A2A5JR75_PSEO7|nr:DASH family cryptochrome [Pseudoalteromonas piscicida]PCK31771.1 deoxyribodipyrimidine photolyase [Pseudoalteromonas piscicida]